MSTPPSLDACLALQEERPISEVSLLPDRLSWRPALERRGYALSYTLFQMRRPPDPCRELPPPAGLRWEAVSEQTVADYYRVVGLAFREIPGAMVPEIAEFSRYALSAHPPAQLLMRADHVVGYARADWGEGTAEVASIGLDPSVRGLGLGDVLLTRALSLALSHHPREVTLVVAAVNDRATRLYLRHGFLPSEEIPVYRKAAHHSDRASRKPRS